MHTNDAAMVKRFAALKEAFQRATGAAFTEVSAEVCLSMLGSRVVRKFWCL